MIAQYLSFLSTRLFDVTILLDKNDSNVFIAMYDKKDTLFFFFKRICCFAEILSSISYANTV